MYIIKYIIPIYKQCRLNYTFINSSHLYKCYSRTLSLTSYSNSNEHDKRDRLSILDNLKNRLDSLDIDSIQSLQGLNIANQNYLLEGIYNFLSSTNHTTLDFKGQSIDIMDLVYRLSQLQLDNATQLDKDHLNDLLRSSFKVTKLLNSIYSRDLVFNLLKLRSVYYTLSDELPKKIFVKSLIDHLRLGKYVYKLKDVELITLYNELTSYIKSQFNSVFENFINTEDLITILELNSELCNFTKSFPAFVYRKCITKLCKAKKLTESQVDQIIRIIINKRFACSTRFISFLIDNMTSQTLLKLTIPELSTFVNYISITYSDVKPSPRIISNIDNSLKSMILENGIDSLTEIINILYFLAKQSYIDSESFLLVMTELNKKNFPDSSEFIPHLDRMIWISLKLHYKNHETIAKMCELSRHNMSKYTIIDIVKQLFIVSKYLGSSIRHKESKIINDDDQLINSIQRYMSDLRNIARDRFDEMQDIQCVSNYLFAVSCTLNDLKLEDYRRIGDRILDLIGSGEPIRGEAVTQILWSFQKNNILHEKLMTSLSELFAQLLDVMNYGQISLCAQTLSTYSLLDENLIIPLLNNAKNRLILLNRKGKTSLMEFSKILSTCWSCVTAGCIDKIPESHELIIEVFKNYDWRDFIRHSTIPIKRQLVHVIIDSDSSNVSIKNYIDKRVLDDAFNSCHNLDDMATASISQYKVRRALSGLNLNFLAESIITTGVVADFVLPDMKIALEIDGPCHFNIIWAMLMMMIYVTGRQCIDTMARLYVGIGKYDLTRLFNKLGYRVISIPWFICHRQGLGEYIKNKLDNYN